MSRFFKSPGRMGEYPRWQEHLLVQSLGFTIVFTIANLIYVGVTQQANYVYSVDFVLLAVQGALLWFARRGYYRQISLAFIVSLWLFLTVGMGEYLSITNPFFNLYVFIVLLAGLLISGRAAAVTAVASIVVGFLSYLSEDSATAQQMFLYMSVLMLVAVYILHKTNEEIEKGVARTLEKQAALEQTNQQLQESEARYRNLIDFASVCVIVNSLDGVIQYANPYAEKVFGADKHNALIGKSSWDYFPPQTRELMQQRMEMLKHGEKTTLSECKLRTLDGRVIEVEVSSLLIQYQGQTAILGILNEVTERNLAQVTRLEAERLRIELEKERQLGKLRDDFITMMSHEFRTPLSVIHSSKDLLERYNEHLTPERRTQHFNKIGSQVTNMVDMLDSMLTLSQANAGMLPFAPRKTDLVQICREVFDRYREVTTRTMHFSTSGVPVEGALFDEKLMRSVISGLLADAQRYTAPDGYIHLSVSHEAHNVMVITVSDDGVSITQEAQNHLFQPFYYHDDPTVGRGTGLELAIVHEFVSLHGGTIKGNNGEHGGVVYTITLPIKRPVQKVELHPA